MPKEGLEKAMAPHSSALAWKTSWTEEPGRLQSMGSLRVGHDWATSLSLSCIGEGNGNPLQCSCLENPRDRGACWAAVYGVAQSRTRLTRLSSSSRGIVSYFIIIIIVTIFVIWGHILSTRWFTNVTTLNPHDNSVRIYIWKKIKYGMPTCPRSNS